MLRAATTEDRFTMPQTLSPLASLAVCTLLLAACGDDTGGSGGSGGAGGGSTAETTTSTGASGEGGAGGSGTGGAGGGGAQVQSFVLQFRGDVDGAPFDCASSYQLGSSLAAASVTDFRFYVHDVRLIDAAGTEVPLALTQDGLWQHQGLALLDFEDRTGGCSNGTTETRTIVEGTAPVGDYVGLAFKVGVPEAMNHLDNATAPSPLNLSALFWSWSSGYKFLRVDAVADDGAGPFNLHVGATGCTGDPALGDAVTCTNPNVIDVVLDGFDPASSVAVFDYAAVVAETDLTTDGGGAPGCMSGGGDPECAAVFPLLGLDLDTGLPSPDTAAAFRVE